MQSAKNWKREELEATGLTRQFRYIAVPKIKRCWPLFSRTWTLCTDLQSNNQQLQCLMSGTVSKHQAQPACLSCHSAPLTSAEAVVKQHDPLLELSHLLR